MAQQVYDGDAMPCKTNSRQKSSGDGKLRVLLMQVARELSMPMTPVPGTQGEGRSLRTTLQSFALLRCSRRLPLGMARMAQHLVAVSDAPFPPSECSSHSQR